MQSNGEGMGSMLQSHNAMTKNCSAEITQFSSKRRR